LSQVKVLDAATASADFRDSRPDWMTASMPALVDSPKYLAWKKFQPGASATYVMRLLTEGAPDTNQYARNKISRSTLRLVSIDDKRAVVSGGSNELIYQAKEPSPKSPSPPERIRR